MGSNVLVARVRVARVLVAGCNVNDGFRLVLVDGHRKVCVDKDRGFCRVWGVAEQPEGRFSGHFAPGAGGCLWLLVVAFGCFWVLVAAFGCIWVLVAGGCFWVLLGACGGFG